VAFSDYAAETKKHYRRTLEDVLRLIRAVQR